MSMPQLTIVMPAYNEELTIADAINDVIKSVAAFVDSAEFIIVDDGSKDKTGAIVRELQKTHPIIKLITQLNAGHGPALRRGIDEAKGDWLLLLDSDRQIDLEAFCKHWPERLSYDVFLGVRKPRHDPGFRLVISNLMRTALGVATGTRPLDAGAPYKIISRKAWDMARPHIRATSWIPSVLLATYALGNPRLVVRQVTILHRLRLHGESTLNAKRLARFCWFAVGDILAFRTSTATGPRK
jgi:dolichol-phosphate mannosyltransferase